MTEEYLIENEEDELDFDGIWRAEIKCNMTKDQLINLLEECIRAQYKKMYKEDYINADPLDELLDVLKKGCVGWIDMTEDDLIDEIDNITDWFDKWLDEGRTHEVFEPVNDYINGD